MLILGGFWWISLNSNAELENTVKISESYEDFIIHIRVEKHEEGMQVLRSIEYTGKEEVIIEHRTPLTQVTIDQPNGSFTGSFVSKTLRPGFSYHPQEPIHFDSLDKGEHKIYVHTQFFIEEERVDIETEGRLVFK